MRIYELVDDETKRQLNAAVHRPKCKKKKQKPIQKKSQQYWEDLMDTKRDRYHRVGGRVKRK